ncbi:MAG: cobyrinate a,c-diamide synthase [Desulforhopalus sp.]
MQTKGLVVAGLAGGSGKSVVSVGLTAALTRRGSNVVPFKKGPDYIDAGWLKIAAGKRCYNLDPYLMSQESIKRSFVEHSKNGDFVIVEGNRGLFDGVNVEGGYSTAELALMLDLPVLLVVNCIKTTRTIAAMVLGCQKFDERLDIRGVVLNHVATERQRRLVTDSVEKYTAIPVLGSIPRLKYDIFPMRHLGMVPHQEYSDSRGALDQLADLVTTNVDIESVESIMGKVVHPAMIDLKTQEEGGGEKIKIGVLQDAAFQFYYSENLEALEKAGGELEYINALEDCCLPALDGLYIGGGFPETSARELADNENFRWSVKDAADLGLPIYAECGGLIYLGEAIELDGEEFPLSGVFPVRFSMSQKPQAHGYTICKVEKDNPYYQVSSELKGHEFRYSRITDWRGETKDLVLKMVRGQGFIDGRDGLTYNNVFALYTHVHADGTPQWATSFVNRCRQAKKDLLKRFPAID